MLCKYWRRHVMDKSKRKYFQKKINIACLVWPHLGFEPWSYQARKHSNFLLSKQQKFCRFGSRLTRRVRNLFCFTSRHQSYLLLQIVRSDRSMEQIVFPIRDTCLYLTNETKQRVLNTAQLDLQGSKVTDFFNHFEDMHNEMKWQRKLKSNFISFRALPNSSFSNYCTSVCIFLFFTALPPARDWWVKI